MACNCNGNVKTPCALPVSVECIDPNGCTFLPWGYRNAGETYDDMNACFAAEMVATWPARLKIVTGIAPAETLEADNG